MSLQEGRRSGPGGVQKHPAARVDGGAGRLEGSSEECRIIWRKATRNGEAARNWERWRRPERRGGAGLRGRRRKGASKRISWRLWSFHGGCERLDRLDALWMMSHRAWRLPVPVKGVITRDSHISPRQRRFGERRPGLWRLFEHLISRRVTWASWVPSDGI